MLSSILPSHNLSCARVSEEDECMCMCNPLYTRHIKHIEQNESFRKLLYSYLTPHLSPLISHHHPPHLSSLIIHLTSHHPATVASLRFLLPAGGFALLALVLVEPLAMLAVTLSEEPARAWSLFFGGMATGFALSHTSLLSELCDGLKTYPSQSKPFNLSMSLKDRIPWVHAYRAIRPRARWEREEKRKKFTLHSL